MGQMFCLPASWRAATPEEITANCTEALAKMQRTLADREKQCTVLETRIRTQQANAAATFKAWTDGGRSDSTLKSGAQHQLQLKLQSEHELEKQRLLVREITTQIEMLQNALRNSEVAAMLQITMQALQSVRHQYTVENVQELGDQMVESTRYTADVHNILMAPTNPAAVATVSDDDVAAEFAELERQFNSQQQQQNSKSSRRSQKRDVAPEAPLATSKFSSSTPKVLNRQPV